MDVSPVPEKNAEGSVKSDYIKIKEALNITYLPLFFTYIGGFPEYLAYLIDQLFPLLQSNKFNQLITESEQKIYPLIKESLNKSEDIIDWLVRYKNSPSFYNFQKDLSNIFIVNLKLAFIFIALREALKGWAIAAKKLTSKNYAQEKSETQQERINDFIFTETSLWVIKQSQLNELDKEIHETGKIEKDLLPRYIFLCQQNYNQLLTTEKYLILRVGIEKLILSSLPLLPEKIISPINIFYKLTEKYQDFPELLYLLYEHYPTYAVQKLIFSGFMKE